MLTNAKVENGNTAIIRYEFTQEELNVLKHLKEHGNMEFKNGGDDVTDELHDKGFVKSDDDAWHYTVVLTKLGKDIVKFL